MFSCALTLQCFASDSSAWGGSPHDFLTRITCLRMEHWNCELVANLSERNLHKSIPTSALDLLQAARSSIKELPSVNPACQLKKAARDTTQAHQASYWNNHLDTLAVQSKFKDIILLEAGCKIWTRIQAGLPAGQLSFMLKAGSDCLPTPLNLCRWRIQTDPKSPLCLWPKPTSAHILNGCSTALNQGRYTWRHDSVLQAIARSVKAVLNSTQRLYANLPGLRACSNPPATIPINLSTSSDRPDLVIVSGSDLTILELTIPANNMENIKNARDRKMTKYQQLIADLDSHPDTTSVKYTTLEIEIGSLGHHISTAVHDLRTACPSLSKQEAHNILTLSAKVAVGCSYHIF